eukprot:GDKH01009612.1.p4 GENE.GDKH01009612.1~~GDKH01009612.1.p4  ORF type:complete len:50 (-),score=6.99 GDKH01009612.1:95-244(-)
MRARVRWPTKETRRLHPEHRHAPTSESVPMDSRAAGYSVCGELLLVHGD